MIHAPPRAQIQEGSVGPDVAYAQRVLGIPADGDFGPTTDAAVRSYQAACGLSADGVVGPHTWGAIDGLALRMENGDHGIPDALMADIEALAADSEIQGYEWDDRGRSPPGYIAGMGQCYALALNWLRQDSPIADEMAQRAGDPDTDALAYYSAEFARLGMNNARDGQDTLRHLFVMLIGLGMRESSGQYCEGRDQSATNVESDTCEAGLFQTSWNINSASPRIKILMDDYWKDPRGFLRIFAADVSPSATDLECYGSGDGARYQWLAKYSPAFATMVTAIGLRTRRSHWGPIGRKEVELRVAADDFLQQVEVLMSGDLDDA